MLYYIGVAIIMTAACWRWGDWRNWKAYYPTILYYIIGDLTSYVLFRAHPLWVYQEWVRDNHFVPDLFYAVFVYPSMIILYLSRFPGERRRQAGYMILWIAGYTLFEFVSVQLHFLSYANGWSILHSAVLNIGMFALLRLHQKKPLLTWPISMALALGMLVLFNIPLNSIE